VGIGAKIGIDRSADDGVKFRPIWTTDTAKPTTTAGNALAACEV
jgi:hypothetical protein